MLLAIMVLTVGTASAQPLDAAGTRQPGHVDSTYLLYGAGFFVPPSGGRLGLAASGELAHDYALGALALSPGLRLAAYFGHQASLAASMVTLRCLLPRQLATPFLSVGVGPGYRSGTAPLAGVVQLGGGLLIAVSARVAIGVEASYLQLTDGAFRQLSVVPLLRLTL